MNGLLRSVTATGLGWRGLAFVGAITATRAKIMTLVFDLQCGDLRWPADELCRIYRVARTVRCDGGRRKSTGTADVT
jgi:hypothetical protein